MKKIMLSLSIAALSFKMLSAQQTIGWNAGLTNYGSQFIEKVNGNNWSNQNNKSFEYSLSYKLSLQKNRDIEFRLGYTNRTIDNIEFSLKQYELNQDYLSLNVFTHKKIMLITDKMYIGIGGGLYTHLLLLETKQVAEINAASISARKFGEIIRVGLISDIPIEISIGRKSSLLIGNQLGFDVLGNLKTSNLFYFNQYLGIHYKL